MAEFKSEQGEMIEVRRNSKGEWEARIFIARHEGGFICARNGHKKLPLRWEQGRDLPVKPEPAEYTRQTWPKQQVMLRHRKWAEDRMTVMAGFNVGGVELSGTTVPYGKLKRDYQMSFDWGETWQPCHCAEES